MRLLLPRLLCFLAVLLWALPAPAQKGPGGSGELTQRQLVADTAAVEAGKPFYAGFHFKIAEEWHTYWQFAGSPGFGLKVTWTLPEGWTAGPVEFPAPHLLTVTEPALQILFGYEHEALFFVKLTPPAQLPPGELKLGATIRWQVCREICIVGNDTLELKLPAGTAQPANTELFAKWKPQLPKDTPPPTEDVTYQAEGNVLKVRLGGLPADAKVDFFPVPPAGFFDALEIGVKTTQETANGARIYGFPFNQPPTVEGWKGLLVMQRGGGPREAWMIGGDPTAPAAPSPALTALPPAPTAPVAAGGDTWDPFAEVAQKSAPDNLWALLLNGFLGGLLLNLMPCVLPVISLKIFGFLQQAGQAKDRVFKLGLAFCAGVFAFFMLLAGLVVGLAAAGKTFGWGAQFSNPLLLTAMLGIVFLFGLSLLGVFEITLGGAESKLSALSSKEGFGGAFTHGFFTTLLGTSCTAPLVGPVIGAAITRPGPQVFALFAAIAIGLALPYFLLTWHPAWMKYLPKPGTWMVRFKQIMGFVMLALMVWLLNSLPSAAATAQVGFFLLTLGVGAWLMGTYHGKGWAIAAAVVLAVGGWFGFVQGKIQARPAAVQIVEKAPPGSLQWEPFSVPRIREALNAGQPVFIDFTAEWCVNCKVVEATAINTTAVIAEMKAKNVLTMKADYTHEPEDIATALRTLGRAGVPLYVYFHRRGDASVEDFHTQSSLLATLRNTPPPGLNYSLIGGILLGVVVIVLTVRIAGRRHSPSPATPA